MKLVKYAALFIAFIFLTMACKKEEKKEENENVSITPVIRETPGIKTYVDSVTGNSAIIRCKIDSQFVGAESVNYTWNEVDRFPAGSASLESFENGVSTIKITGLQHSTTYVVRGYVNKKSEKYYGNSVSFKTSVGWTLIKEASFTNAIVGMGSQLFAINNGSVFVSNNNGDTWNAKTNGLGGYASCISFLNDKILVGTNTKGIFQSTDKGESWEPMNTGLSSNELIRCLHTSGNGIFAATNFNGLFKFDNNANSWTKVLSTGTDSESVKYIVSTNTAIFAASSHSLYLSKNMGSTWSTVTSGLGIDPFINELGVIDQSVFVMTSTGSVYVSNDNNNWSQVEVLKDVFQLASTGKNAVAKKLSGNSLLITKDGGTKWTNQVAGINLDNNFIFSVSATKSFFFAGTTRGLYRIPVE